MPDKTTDIRISDVVAYPITQRLPRPSITSWGQYDAVSAVLVKIETDAGISGAGECLARFAPGGVATVIEELFRPMLVGQLVADIGRHRCAMLRGYSGRPGGLAMEAIAGVDIALWDILGKVAGLPLFRLFGGEGRTELPVYGSSVDWGEDAVAEVQLRSMLSEGYRAIKLKLAGPAREAIRRVEFARRIVGDDIDLFADANWAFTLGEAAMVGEALAANGYGWFEEPIHPEDIEGYRWLRSHLKVPLAAGESDFSVAQSRELLSSRLVDVIQPNITRAGGITGVNEIASYAAANHVKYATHAGFSGIVCEVASFHVAAAAPNLHSVEIATNPNLFRENLSSWKPANLALRDGKAVVPQEPGLGIEVDWDAAHRMVQS